MKDRISQNPGRVLVKPENGGAEFYATLERADNPIQEGDALNKANLLKDETAALLGLGEDAVPDDAFASLGWHRWRRRTEERGYNDVLTLTSVFIVGGNTNGNVCATVYYSDSYTYADGIFTLDNPENVNIYNMSSHTAVFYKFAGKYFLVGATNGDFLYKATDDIVNHGSARSGDGFTFSLYADNQYKLTKNYYENIGEYEYVTSPNRHAYPDSGREGIFTYEYLGSPLENAREAYGLRLHWWKRRVEESGYTPVVDSAFATYTFRATNGYITTFYSDTCVVNEDNTTMRLVDAKSLSFNITNGYTNASWLSNKYFYTVAGNSASPNESLTVIYKGGDSVAYELASTSTITLVAAKTTVQYYKSVGEYEYLSSPNRNAYPDSGVEGIFSYQYLAVPFENAREGAKVVTGSYVGTGTYGQQSNSCSLTFETEPKMVLIGGMSHGYAPMPYIKGDRSFVVQYGSNTSINPVTINGTTISWYGGTAAYQLNTTGVAYPYFAIL